MELFYHLRVGEKIAESYNKKQLVTPNCFWKVREISMAKQKSQESKLKKGLPRLMELAMTQKVPMVGGMILSALATIASFLPYLAIYFIIQEIVGAYPDFSTLDVPKVVGYGGLALGGVLLNVLLYTASVALSHIAAYGTTILWL